ncbi:MAG: helix-hairpin-helix domain-containing protein [Burkholderiales bacterium]
MTRILAAFALALAILPATAIAAVNLNTATKEELVAVPGIGPTKAQAIVDHRSAHGPFKSVDDLKGVKGFRAKLVEKLKSEFTVASSSPRGARKDAKAAPQPKDAKPATEAARADAGRIQEERRK